MANIKPQQNNLYAYRADVFTSAEIDSIVELGLQLRLDDSVTILSDTERRRSTNAWVYPTAESQWLYNKMHQVINEINMQFFRFDINMIEPFQFAQYDASRSEFYGKHLDSTYGEMNPSASRKLSVTLQLTDETGYDGGELQLYQSEQPLVAPKKKGMLVVFPSFIMHEVTPVTRGTRHSLVTWCHGPLFK